MHAEWNHREQASQSSHRIGELDFFFLDFGLGGSLLLQAQQIPRFPMVVIVALQTTTKLTFHFTYTKTNGKQTTLNFGLLRAYSEIRFFTKKNNYREHTASTLKTFKDR